MSSQTESGDVSQSEDNDVNNPESRIVKFYHATGHVIKNTANFCWNVIKSPFKRKSDRFSVGVDSGERDEDQPSSEKWHEVALRIFCSEAMVDAMDMVGTLIACYFVIDPLVAFSTKRLSVVLSSFLEGGLSTVRTRVILKDSDSETKAEAITAEWIGTGVDIAVTVAYAFNLDNFANWYLFQGVNCEAIEYLPAVVPFFLTEDVVRIVANVVKALPIEKIPRINKDFVGRCTYVRAYERLLRTNPDARIKANIYGISKTLMPFIIDGFALKGFFSPSTKRMLMNMLAGLLVGVGEAISDESVAQQEEQRCSMLLLGQDQA